ncbi:unnamed protein product [Adineta steineri]|uniref:EGF-like domain-containing protein n=1 Tax=Adineta steineri TaxID=433720 RepID=A0A819QRP8_9BILA|nr:unnamed protein product [Adineta steineri]CAF4036111.1 unnamed protein product [Adineta steineri]
MNPMNKIIAFLVLIFVTTSDSQSCSTYNPCGQYGYCVEISNVSSECICKFWWVGSYCNEQSSSGIQVIVLGVLVAILLIVFYGLSIFCWARRRKQQPKKEEKRNSENNLLQPKLTHVAFTNVKESTRFSSCLIVVLMIIVATVSLVVKWSLLQPIHNELVDKYTQKEPLFYVRNSFCNAIDFQDGYNLITISVSCFCIIIFIVFSKRTSCLRGKLNGFFGPVIPLDFYVHVKRKFAAVVFAVIADDLLDIVVQVIDGSTSQGEGVIVVYLLRVVKILIIGLHHYPTLSAVYIDSILALACGTLYTWLDFIISIINQGLCQTDYYPSDDNVGDTNGSDLESLFDYYGTGQNLIIIELLTDIPRYLCWAYIVIKLPMLLINKINATIKKRNRKEINRIHLTREEKILLHSSAAHSVEMCYVRNLFRGNNEHRKSRLFIGRLIPKFIYEWRDDFRFSSRIVCVYASVFLLLYFMTIQALIRFIPVLNVFQELLEVIFDAITTIGDSLNIQKDFPMPNLLRPFVFAILTAFVVTVIQLLILLASIRRNLFQIYRGDDSEIPLRNKSKYLSYAGGNFHFAGYFIGYLIWGYVLIAVFALIIYICIASFITFGSVRFLEKILKSIIPVVLLIIFKQYLNNLLARYVFLQHYGDILAINNRRILMIFLYFNFFLDSFLGFVSSIIRIIKSVIGGFLYMTRLDYSPLGRKLETLDSGFSAYCGFIHIEAVHRNPIMLVAVSYLYGRMKAKQYILNNRIVTIENEKNYSSKAIRKWHLAVFLLRNPRLVFSRKNALREKENKNMEALNAKLRRLSLIEQITHRPSLISENDLENMWQK